MMYRAIILVTLAGLVACSSAPKRDLGLEQLRASLQSLENDGQLKGRAPEAMINARAAVRAAENSTQAGPEVREHLVYMAEKQIDIARASAEVEFEADQQRELERARDRILVQASLQEAERARRAAEQARLESVARTEEAERMRREVESTRQRNLEIERQAEMAREEADQAKRLAEARGREADAARQEAEAAAAAVAALRRQLQGLQTEQTDRGVVITLGDLSFESASPTLLPEAASNIEQVATYANGQYGGREIMVEGHTDSRGSAEFNLQLSQDRADSVKAALVAAGVDAQRITALGLGEDFPIDSNESEVGRSRNRRVEIVIQQP